MALIAEVSLEKKNTKACTHCGTIGHTIEDCYKKHGYPSGHILY